MLTSDLDWIMKMKLLVVSLSLLSGSVLAIEPASIKTDSGIELTPLLDSKLEHDSNIYNSSNNEKSSGKLILNPSVNLTLDDALNSYTFGASLEHGTFFSSSEDNYLDSNLLAEVHLEPAENKRVDLSYTYGWLTELRGTGLSEGAGESLTEANEFKQHDASFRYEYGLVTSSRFAVISNFRDTKYRNNRLITQFRDSNNISMGAEFLHAYSAITDLTFDIEQSKISYDQIDQTGVSRDSHVLDYRVGARWEATALTTGIVKVGYQTKTFKEDLRNNFYGLSWLVQAQWSPLTYSQFTISSNAGSVDPDLFGDYIDQKGIAVSWQHAWSEMIATSVQFSFTNDDFSGFDREDDSQELSLGITHNTARWIESSFYVSFQEKESNLDQFAFDKTIVGVNFTVSM